MQKNKVDSMKTANQKIKKGRSISTFLGKHIEKLIYEKTFQ